MTPSASGETAKGMGLELQQVTTKGSDAASGRVRSGGEGRVGGDAGSGEGWGVRVSALVLRVSDLSRAALPVIGH